MEFSLKIRNFLKFLELFKERYKTSAKFSKNLGLLLTLEVIEVKIFSFG